MHNLIISYDLHAPDKNYEAVIKAIKSLGAWAHLQGSVWYVKSAKSASEACDALIAVLDSNDSVFVTDSARNQAAWGNLSSEVSNFLNNNWTGR